MAERARDPRAFFWHKRNVARERPMADLEALLRCLRAGGAYHDVGDATLRRRAPRRSCGGRVVGGLRSRCCGHGCGEDRALTAIGVAGRLRRQWLRWLTEHGEAYEYDVSI